MRQILALLLLLACLSNALAQGTKTIDTLRDNFMTAFNKGDAAALEKIYEPNALLLTFSGQAVKGGSAIAKGMAGMSAQMDLAFKPLQSRESGDMLYEAGTWTHYAKGTKTARQTGTYLWVWKKMKDDWRLEILSVTAAAGTPIGD